MTHRRLIKEDKIEALVPRPRIRIELEIFGAFAAGPVRRVHSSDPERSLFEKKPYHRARSRTSLKPLQTAQSISPRKRNQAVERTKSNGAEGPAAEGKNQ